MTPKEKAIQLVDMFQTYLESPLTKGLRFEDAKQCALICVEEMLQASRTVLLNSQRYYEEVMEEIEKL